MRLKEQKVKLISGWLAAAGIVILALAEWNCHRRITFMMDDLWYGTNLATDQALRGLPDIIESQAWHFMNWGGRCMTHGILQMTLMSGSFAADVMNMAAVFFLSWMICVMADFRKPFGFLLASTLLVALNANVRMSMFWQSGAVNYVYSTAWILVFLWPYLRQLERPEAPALPLAGWWMAPLGLMAGWSNENMGPACFIVSLGTVFYLLKKNKARLCPWMLTGSLTCLAGSILVVCAPGNFVRMNSLEKKTLGDFLYDRFCSMLHAGAEFLFPAVILLTVLALVWMVCRKGRFGPGRWMLLALAVLSYGAMVLSPHYPDRATFGTMTVCIVLSLSLLGDILKAKERLKISAGWMTLAYWCYAIYVLSGV